MKAPTRWLTLLLAGALLVLGLIVVRYRNSANRSAKQSNHVSTPHGFQLGFETMEAHEGNPPIESPGDGHVKIKSKNDTLTVIIELQGLKPNARYNTHLHEGSCETGGAGGVSLAAVQSDTDGRGMSRSVVSFRKLNPTMDHLIMVHNPRGQHILCADVPPLNQFRTE